MHNASQHNFESLFSTGDREVYLGSGRTLVGTDDVRSLSSREGCSRREGKMLVREIR